MGYGPLPKGRHLVHLAAEPDGIDLGRGGQGTYYHGEAVASAFGIHHLLEEEGFALLLRDAAPKLPAYQRVELRIFVDGDPDALEESAFFQRLEVVAQVWITAPWRGDHCLLMDLHSSGTSYLGDHCT